MAFKYINPGCASLLDTGDGITVEGATYSKTGLSFWQPTIERGIELIETPTELYGKFDAYLHYESDSESDDVEIMVLIGKKNGIKNGVKVIKHYDEWSVCGLLSSGWVVYKEASVDYPENFKTKTHLKLEDINTFYFHVKPTEGTQKGKISLWVNGVLIGTGERDDVSFYESKTLEIVSTAKHGLISNIILSDREIDPREQVVMLPSTIAETTMEDSGNGIYTASAAGQMLLQTADTTALAATYGEKSQVTGIALIGNPAYRTGSGLCTLTAIEKNGELITEYGKHVLTDQTSGSIVDSRAISLRLPELTGRKFGWKAGE